MKRTLVAEVPGQRGGVDSLAPTGDADRPADRAVEIHRADAAGGLPRRPTPPPASENGPRRFDTAIKARTKCCRGGSTRSARSRPARSRHRKFQAGRAERRQPGTGGAADIEPEISALREERTIGRGGLDNVDLRAGDVGDRTGRDQRRRIDAQLRPAAEASASDAQRQPSRAAAAPPIRHRRRYAPEKFLGHIGICPAIGRRHAYRSMYRGWRDRHGAGERIAPEGFWVRLSAAGDPVLVGSTTVRGAGGAERGSRQPQMFCAMMPTEARSMNRMSCGAGRFVQRPCNNHDAPPSIAILPPRTSLEAAVLRYTSSTLEVTPPAASLLPVPPETDVR